jgi:hypothetical protein
MKKLSGSTLVVLAVGALALYFILKGHAGGAKYKVGDVLQIGTVAETFTVIGFQTVGNVLQYVLRSSNYPGTADFALDVPFVDSNPQWHKVG